MMHPVSCDLCPALFDFCAQAAKWKDRVLLERNFTMNGNWMDYAGKWIRGSKRLAQSVWGNDRVPFVVQYAGCQMCRGHSENGTWHDQGVKKCHNAFLEAYTFSDDQAYTLILPWPRMIYQSSLCAH